MTMNNKQIYRLAWGMALEIWSDTKDYYEKYPNVLSEKRLRKAKEQLDEIEELLLREERKND